MKLAPLLVVWSAATSCLMSIKSCPTQKQTRQTLKPRQTLSPTKMSAEIQAAADFRVKYSRRTHSDGREREYSEVQMIDDGEQHPDVGIQAAGK